MSQNQVWNSLAERIRHSVEKFLKSVCLKVQRFNFLGFYICTLDFSFLKSNIRLLRKILEHPLLQDTPTAGKYFAF